MILNQRYSSYETVIAVDLYLHEEYLVGRSDNAVLPGFKSADDKTVICINETYMSKTSLKMHLINHSCLVRPMKSLKNNRMKN